MRERLSYRICLMLLPMVMAVAGCADNKGPLLPDEEQLAAEFSRVPMLYTVEAQVEVLVEGQGKDGTAEWKSIFGKREIIVPVRANIKAGIDLSAIDDMKVEGDKVWLTLPDPVIEIESTEIPWHEVVSNVTGMRDEFSNREKEFLTRKGRMKIVSDLSSLDLVVPAQEHAEQLITHLLNSFGYKPVFRKRPVYTERELLQFVK